MRISWATTLAGLGLLLIAGPTLLSSTFTIWNVTCLLAQGLDFGIRRAPPRLLPYLTVNSWAIFTSFNVIALVYPSHYVELARRLDTGMPLFHFLNTLGHFVPGIICAWWFEQLDAGDRADACAWTDVAPVAYTPLAYHLLWALRIAGGLVLDHVYLKRPRFQWYISWATGTATHLVVGRLVARSCAEGISLTAAAGW